MKIYIICLALLFSFDLIACPYGSMAEIDKNLQSTDINLTSEKYSKILDLRFKGEEALKLGNLEEQIYYLDRWLGLDEGNLDVLNKFSEFYKNNSMFEEQVEILNMILKILLDQ